MTWMAKTGLILQLNDIYRIRCFVMAYPGLMKIVMAYKELPLPHLSVCVPWEVKQKELHFIIFHPYCPKEVCKKPL
jgi:hypothetical protein